LSLSLLSSIRLFGIFSESHQPSLQVEIADGDNSKFQFQLKVFEAPQPCGARV
jgi:hypothetical protein